jgi:uncharacterized protein YdeI (YjbR/CyaY-like superfamily)
MAKPKRDIPIIAFKSQQAWNDWLALQAADSDGLWLKLAKKSSRIPCVTRPEAIDTALCHGWIDGQLDSFDENHSLVRFTPRRPSSRWSERNRTRALQLIEMGRMLPAGMREIERARKDGRWEAAYAPQSTAEVPDDLKAALARNKKASKFFETLDRANRYAVLYRVHNARKPETRAAKIETFVAMLAAGETIHPQKPKKPS